MFNELENYFGTKVAYEKVDKLKGLPLFMVIGREFYQIEIAEKKFLLVCLAKDDKFGTIALKKQLEKYVDAVKMQVAYSFDIITKVQRDALIKHHIPFVSLPSQVYLPFLGVVLEDKFPIKKKVNISKMMPATQQLFLYLFYKKSVDTVMKKQAAEELKLTRTSITRASEQLLAMGLIEQKKIGKEILMTCKEDRHILYEKAKPYLINPIQKVYTVEYDKELSSFLLAGETALGKQTMLNEPKIKEFAVYKGADIIKSLKILDEQWDTDKNIVKLQLWKYEPALFENNGCVDAVSLACSLEEEVDERVEMAVEELLEGTKW